MRLVCPQCSAQYEIADGAIPPSGRDVQCSSCGHMWFQSASPAATDALTAGEEVDAQDPAADAPQTKPSPFDTLLQRDETPEQPTPSEAPMAEDAVDERAAESNVTHFPASPSDHADGPDDELVPPAFEDADPAEDRFDTPNPEALTAAASAALARGRRTIDPSVLDVLREEAALEAEVRKAETDDTPDTRPTESPKAHKARARMDALRNQRATTDTRRDLLPDIEEINSSLRHDQTGASASADAPDQGQGGRGFRFGFGGTLLVAALAVAVYVNADKIVQSYPQTAAALGSYVEGVNSGRVWLDQTYTNVLSSLRDATAPTSE